MAQHGKRYQTLEKTFDRQHYYPLAEAVEVPIAIEPMHPACAKDWTFLTDLQSVVATWSTRLGPHASASLGLRHNRFDSDTNPYNESALIGSVRLQF